MKSYLIFIIILLCSIRAEAESLYRVSSKDMGITQFDVNVLEVDRTPTSSTLKIPGFHDRSAAASRWLMCAYTDLAVKRGFLYWNAFYPELDGDELLLVFPASESPEDPAYEGMEINLDDFFVSSVARFAPFCGIKIE